MARKKKSERKKKKQNKKKSRSSKPRLSQETRNWIYGILALVGGLFLVISWLGAAGKIGGYVFAGSSDLLGVGYFMLPLALFVLTASFIQHRDHNIGPLRLVSILIFLIAGLGIVSIFFTDQGGIIGSLIASPLVYLLDIAGSLLILIALLLISLLIIFEAHIDFHSLLFWKREKEEGAEEKKEEEVEPIIATPEGEEKTETQETPQEKKESFSLGGLMAKKKSGSDGSDSEELTLSDDIYSSHDYTPPPLSLLKKNSTKPGVGDIKANANLIKRTLQNFNIDVEMDEISVGPTVTRYALKPAEGVRLSKIVGLQNNLELALAAHPVRIEAPIPGQSLVGIEVPNTSKAMVGLADLFSSREFSNSAKPLLISLGKSISGNSYFADLGKAPHMLIAGATGSGKSVTIHALLNSLIFRNSPENLKLILVDPKRVELTLYNGIPHLLTPVITDAKKTILALKWAAKEMDRRYDVLEENKVRDISSYHKNVYQPAKEKGVEEDEKMPERMPYLVIILDELADIMQAYPRELESAIVRLAQMSRAVGIHLVLSTQRPSVNVITGLIKANVPSRIALQVSSQVDSRTILDGTGAEKLLGAGDMLYQSGDMSKPIRLQSAFISENEVKSVVKYLQKQYEDELNDEINIETSTGSNTIFEADLESDDLTEEDELYEDAREIVINAGKGSTSYIQRKLRVGYARAARLMDMLEEQGIVGPQDGSKPRDVLVETSEETDDEVDDDNE